MVESVPSNKFLFCCGVVNGYFISAKMTKDGSSPSMVGPSKLSIRVCSQQSLFVFGGEERSYFTVNETNTALACSPIYSPPNRSNVVSKFKAGDKVYALGYPHKDWEYEVLMVGLVSAADEPCVLALATKVPKHAVVKVGYSSLLKENKLAKLPTIVRSFPVWHVYYLDVHGRVQFRTINAKNLRDEADVKLHILNYHGGSRVLEVTKVEREFEVD